MKRLTPFQKMVMAALNEHKVLHLAAWGKKGLVNTIRSMFSKNDGEDQEIHYKCTGMEVVVWVDGPVYDYMVHPDFLQYTQGFKPYQLWDRDDFHFGFVRSSWRPHPNEEAKPAKQFAPIHALPGEADG